MQFQYPKIDFVKVMCHPVDQESNIWPASSIWPTELGHPIRRLCPNPSWDGGISLAWLPSTWKQWKQRCWGPSSVAGRNLIPQLSSHSVATCPRCQAFSCWVPNQLEMVPHVPPVLDWSGHCMHWIQRAGERGFHKTRWVWHSCCRLITSEEITEVTHATLK